MTDSISRRFVIDGVVQGVGYRAYVRRAATSLALRGYVRNLPDGTVEVLVEGPPTAVSALESALRRGPPFATVAGITVSEVDSQGFAGMTFEVN